MTTVDDCEAALKALAARLADNDPGGRKSPFDRSLACIVRDLDVVFAGQLKDGRLLDVRRVTDRNAQIRLDLTADDLLALVEGRLKVPAAWASGRLKIDAGVRDLIRLKSLF